MALGWLGALSMDDVLTASALSFDALKWRVNGEAYGLAGLPGSTVIGVKSEAVVVHKTWRVWYEWMKGDCLIS